MNQIMLPLVGETTIFSFFKYLGSKHLSEWPEMLASKMSPSGSFFLRYMIHLSFISNSFQLLSISKVLYDLYYSRDWLCRKKKKQPLNLADFYRSAVFYSDTDKDVHSFYFDIVYQQAFSISMFALVFLFSL